MTRHVAYIVPLLAFFAAVSAHSPTNCVYTFYIKTGDLENAGTDSEISVNLGDNAGNSIWIRDLREWGLMSPRHDYFERGHLDIFSVRASCLSQPICKIALTSSGKGSFSAWFVEYAEVTYTGPHEPCSKNAFIINSWLSHDPSYGLSVVQDNCNYEVISQAKEEKNGLSHSGSAAAADD